MNNPYLIKENTSISFSGGRTSGYMLYKILEANNGLPDNAVVCFANTGKEEESTLEFVRDCSLNWNVPITWLEFVDSDEKFKIVDFETASRKGEPFEALILKKKYLPNPVTRFCTIEMKIRPMAKYLHSIGFAEKPSHGEKMAWVGIRADEPRRAAKISDKERIPLFFDGVTKEMVGEFWKQQDFDLNLPNMNGVTMHGNCDLCFLKGGNQVQSLINEKPERAIWWAEMEKLIKSENVLSHEGTARFRKDRPSYQQMIDNSKAQVKLDFIDESIACFCGD
jgi:3'-phosphoadenosine 5'-phosphosulfate sulfotransferase (PAPS reductase)/FAD synthetase